MSNTELPQICNNQNIIRLNVIGHQKAMDKPTNRQNKDMSLTIEFIVLIRMGEHS